MRGRYLDAADDKVVARSTDAIIQLLYYFPPLILSQYSYYKLIIIIKTHSMVE